MATTQTPKQKPELLLSLATRDDLPDIVRTQFSAFHPEDPMHVLLYPSPHPVPDSIIDKTVQRHLSSWDLNPEHIVWLKITIPSSSTPDLIIAASKWYILPQGKRWPEMVVDWVAPKPASISDSNSNANGEGGEGEGGNVGLGVNDKEYIEYIIGEYYGRRQRRCMNPCVLLDLCFVHRDFQGMGAGGVMVGWGVGEADRLGVEAWVEASYPGKRVYEKGGFEIIEHVQLDGGKMKKEWKPYRQIGYYFMHRDAKLKTGEV